MFVLRKYEEMEVMLSAFFAMALGESLLPVSHFGFIINI
jgi:hypothetical protein